MRYENEMYDLILKVAKEEGILAIIMNGSRINRNVQKDMFQDYNIVYVVESREEVIFSVDAEHLINRFGQISYIRKPVHEKYLNTPNKDSYTWLVQYTDGSRLDLTIATVNYANKILNSDSLSKILYDRDNIFRFVRPDETSYYLNKITEKEFEITCNEFWWSLNSAGKGICRGQLNHVFDVVNFDIRPILLKIIDQKIGYEHDFKVNVGYKHKYLKNLINSDLYDRLLKTYDFSTEKKMWEAIFTIADLFSEIVEEVLKYSKYTYNYEEARNSYSHLKQLLSHYQLTIE